MQVSGVEQKESEQTVNVIAWLRSKNITTHAVAGFLVVIATIITTDPQVQQLLIALLKAHPAIVADVVLVAGIIAKYSLSSSPAGTLATARDIKASPDTPTRAQVDAADTSIKP